MENKGIVGRLGLGGLSVVTMFGLGVLLAGPSSAADSDVTAAFTTLSTDIGTYVKAIVGLVLLSVGAMLGIKYIRKGVSKA